MFGVVCKNEEVLRAVILLVVVSVMDNLFRIEVSAEDFFNDQPVFKDVALTSVWMIR